MLATAKKHFARLFGFVLNWSERSGLMGTVTERLIIASATGAPEICFASLNVDCNWRFLCDNWSIHFHFLLPRCSTGRKAT